MLTSLRTNIEDEVLRAAVSQIPRQDCPTFTGADDTIGLQIWAAPVGASIFAPREKDPETMQSALGRMAGPWYPQGRVVTGGR